MRRSGSDRYRPYDHDPNPEPSKIAYDFSLHDFEDYDQTFPNVSWPIGFHSDYPDILKRRLSAALITTQMGNSSVDYVMKTYLSDAEFDDAPRADAKYLAFIKKSHATIHDIVYRLTHHDDGTLGRVLAEWALLRQEFSAHCLLLTVNRGALFEGYCLIRMQLEQLAWVVAIDRQNDAEAIKKVRAQSSIGRLREIVPEAGLLYGHLSQYAHWDYAAHVRALQAPPSGGVGILFSSVAHKIELLQAAILFVRLLASVVVSIRAGEIVNLEDGKGVTKQLDDIGVDAIALKAELAAYAETAP